MISLLAHVKEPKDRNDPKALENNLNIMMRRAFRKHCGKKSRRNVLAEEWRLVASAPDGQWDNYETKMLGLGRKRPVLGTVTVRVWHPISEPTEEQTDRLSREYGQGEA